MKARRPRNVYLSRQAAEILTALKSCAGASPYILQAKAKNSPKKHISLGTLNKVLKSIVAQAKSENMP
jgi:hypothetical protein